MSRALTSWGLVSAIIKLNNAPDHRAFKWPWPIDGADVLRYDEKQMQPRSHAGIRRAEFQRSPTQRYEELKGDKLNALRTAAQSLQIVGVRPKPKGLAADLKADKALLEDQESMVSLLNQGFIPYPNGDTTEILANAGETLLTTKDGVRYTLRFGEEVLASGSVETSADDKDKEATPASNRQRYLLVTASLDESKFPAPELQPVPETIEDLKRMDAEKAAAEEARKP